MSTLPDPTPNGVPSSTDVPAVDLPVAEPFAQVPAAESTAPDPLGTDLPDAAPGAGEIPAAAGPTTTTEREPDLRPLYAVAGLTEVLVGAVRTTVTGTQHWASARIAELRFRQAELEKQAAELRERADVLPEQVKTLPEVTRGRVGELQQQATNTYADLAGRGQRLVQGVAGRVDPVFDRVQDGVDAARRIVTGRVGGVAAGSAVMPETVVPETVVPAPEPVVPEVVVAEVVPEEELIAEEVLLTEGVETTLPDEGSAPTR